jgi:hypothetical protein
MMQEVNAQMVLRLHQMSGEPIANCNYLLAQTNGDYELAWKILERILQQRKAGEEQGIPSGDGGPAPIADSETAGPQAPYDALENRVSQLEGKLTQLADTLDAVNEKLSLLLAKVSGTD